MKLYCLTHSHADGTDSYLFKAKGLVDAGEAAAQLGVDFLLFEDERIIVGEVTIDLEDLPLFYLPVLEV